MNTVTDNVTDELWLGDKRKNAMKSKRETSVIYKKGTVANNKKDIQQMLDESVIIEILEQSDYSDGLESATIRMRFHKKAADQLCVVVNNLSLL